MYEDSNVDLPEGVSKIEKNERFVNENGKKKKITKIIKYMDNGEINTEVFKTDMNNIQTQFLYLTNKNLFN